jgi:hypothetical protein
MTTTLGMVAAGLLCFYAGWLGCTITSRKQYLVSLPNRRPKANPKDIARYMARVVNLEELEANRRAVHRQMVQSGRRSVRVDGGENARVMRMRKRRRGSQIRSQNS